MVCNKFQRINGCTTQSSKKNTTTKEDFFFSQEVLVSRRCEEAHTEH